jgi:hypothetical protein
MHGLMLLVALAQSGDDWVGPDRTKPNRPAPPIAERRPDAVLQWNEHALEAIRRDRTAPPVAARNLAILHGAIADAVNVIYQTHRPYRVRLRATQNIEPDVAVAVTAHRVLAGIYPRQRGRLDRLLDRALAAVPAGDAKSRGVKLGRHVADRYLAWRRDDTIPRTTTYRPSRTVGLWRPTPPGHASALLPSWSETPPFGVRSVRAFRPVAPPELTSAEYAEDFNEVKRLGGRDSLKRTAEQSIIAWFWEGGSGTCTPPGQWNQIAQEVSLAQEQPLTLAENARLFALLNIALADAGIVCWDCKYHFRLWRPVTAIHEADRDDNPDTHRDARWESLLVTPAFPSYTSGHSTFSGAASTILAKFFGTDGVRFTVGSDSLPGTQRSYPGFDNAAREAGRSRIYGGIHYECDNCEGLALGRAVAEEIYRTRLLLDQVGAASRAAPEAGPARLAGPTQAQAQRGRRDFARPLTVFVRRDRP